MEANSSICEINAESGAALLDQVFCEQEQKGVGLENLDSCSNRGRLYSMIVSTNSRPEPTRLDRFRELRARLDPAGDPARAFAEQLYVPVAGSVSERLTAQLAVAPTSAHLLVGGVGSGKTTELLAVQQQLNRIEDTRAFYVDVSKGHDIRKLMPSAIVYQAARALGLEFLAFGDPSREQHHSVSKTLKHLSNITDGYVSEYGEHHEDAFDVVPGVLQQANVLDEQTVQAQRMLSSLVETIQERWLHLVVLIDGLDRVTDIPVLEKAMRSDLTVLHGLCIGTVLVGPLRALYGIDRDFLENFSNTYSQPWIDTTRATNGNNLLRDALRRRLPAAVLDESALETLVANSGGVLRDLMSLAQSACVEAYMNGSETIAKTHADSAVDAFGRKHMQGLRSLELEVLNRVRIFGTFVQTSEDDLALLMSRRLLEYVGPNEERRYVVHPTIVPFLAQVAGSR